ncbi:MAG: hypothetical protein AAF206_01415 [Bacteroidota bacterium]
MNLQVESVALRDWEDSLSGLLIAENDDWLLLHYIPVDYVLDGYKIIRKSVIESRQRDEKHQLVEKVFRLRGVHTHPPLGFQFSEVEHMLHWVEQRFGFFEFQDDEEDEVLYGKVSQIDEERDLSIDFVDAEGQQINDYEAIFELDSIRIISFDSDYFNAIHLLWQDNQQ